MIDIQTPQHTHFLKGTPQKLNVKPNEFIIDYMVNDLSSEDHDERNCKGKIKGGIG